MSGLRTVLPFLVAAALAGCGETEDDEPTLASTVAPGDAAYRSTAYTYGPVAYRVNVGGGSLAGTPQWLADTSGSPSVYGNAAQTGNRTYSTNQAIDLGHSSIPAATPAALFQTERWDPATLPEMTWNFPVQPGQYEVRLYFAEIYTGTMFTGARKFDVLIEGRLVLDDFDVYATVGGNRGWVGRFVTNSDSTLTIAFGHVVENPSLKAIEIVPVIEATPPETGVLYRVNAGGGAASGAPTWSEDTAASPSAFVNALATGNRVFSVANAIHMNDPSLPEGTPQSIFQSERWDPAGGPEMTWSFAVTPGTYEVRLYFAEIYTGAMITGARVFSVFAEGQRLLQNFDVYQAAGAYRGIMRAFKVTSDSSLDISFVHGVENPSIKAIEILSSSSAPPPPPSETPPVILENQKSGDADYQILNPGETYAYAVPSALRAGETVNLHVSSSVSGAGSYRLYRMGYYGGKGARLIATGSFTAGPQPVPPPDATTGMIECNWPVSATIQTGTDWPSGYYIAKVKGANGHEKYAAFTLIGTHKPKILVSLPTATYQAYNYWGGTSLYVNQHKDKFPNHNHAVVVSFHRPNILDGGSGEFLRRDHFGVKWLEAAGYDIGYVSNIYVAEYPEVLEGSAMYLSIGHDEYWPHRMRNAMEAALDRGMHFVFWSGNTGLWQTRVEPKGSDPIGRMVGYKDYWKEDPMMSMDHAKVTGAFRDWPVSRPENAFLGIMWECCGISPSPWLPHVSSSAIWSSTGLATGMAVPLAVGGEFDRRWNNGFEPAGLEILSESPVIGSNTRLEVAHASRYQAPSGAWVYAMGSIDWQKALGQSGSASSAFQQFNANVLEHVDEPRGTIHPADIATRVVANSPVWLNTTVSTVAGSGVAGFGDGGVSYASFHEPRGIALGPGGVLYVADARNGAVRSISGGSVATVVSGMGFPNGIAVLEGKVYVSDPWRHVIWELNPVAKTKTVLAGGKFAYQDGQGPQVGFSNLNPLIASPGEGVLYALDLPHGVRRIDPSGNVTTVFTTGVQGWGLVRKTGGFYTAIPSNFRIVGLGIADLAGNGDYGIRDGAAATAAFTGPGATVGTSDGTVFVTDMASGVVRRIKGGQAVSVAGKGYGYIDGIGTSAQFRVPVDLAYDEANRQLYVADAGNNVIRMIQLP